MLSVFVLIMLLALVVSSLTSFVKYKKYKIEGYEQHYIPLATQGFLAAMCVPMFLGISGSDLFDSLQKLLSNATDPDNDASSKYIGDLFKLIGLFVIASTYADEFLSKVSGVLLKGLKENNEKIKKQEALLNQQQQELAETNRAVIERDFDTSAFSNEQTPTPNLSQQEQQLLNHFKKALPSKFKKSVELSKELECEITLLDDTLEMLKSKNLVDRLSRYNAWYLTAEGLAHVGKVEGV
jgi:hypothetical protein